MQLSLSTPVGQLPGSGPAREKKLAKLGLHSCGDLLGYYPRDYEDRRQIYRVRRAPVGTRVCVVAMVADRPRLSRIRRGLELVQLRAVDQTGTLHVTFFNQSYVARALEPGVEYVFYGTVEEKGSRRSMTNPVFERADAQNVTGCILPVYPLTAGIHNHLLAGLVRRAMECAGEVPEHLPEDIRQQYELCPILAAVENLHFPADLSALEQARRRLAFEELFYLSVGLSFLKNRRDTVGGAVPVAALPPEEFFSLLPFAPTPAQRRVMEEISRDLAGGRPMNRLVQGDVGSGKTVVAAFAVWCAARAGAQSALMVPTEVLAEQHYRSLSAMLAPAGIRVGLLSGSLSAGEKTAMRRAVAAGEVDLVVGTHALISPSVRFARLGLIVADEQHRFGVSQRAALAGKSGDGTTPHVLVMSATPIPRTLALIVYGDLDVSVIDQLPPGRVPVETYVVGEDKRQRLYGFVRRQVQQGRQVYIICPAVEEEGADGLARSADHTAGAADLKAVKSHALELQQKVFPDLQVGILHGKMRPAEKEAVMAAFAAGQTQVLVSTTVVEVGVDVANASLIVIENAERFGLSQLHQLRGRVGRGKHQSYCVLVTRSHSQDSLTRLRTLASTTDGFAISEADLKLRGPGDFFGSRQHGLPQLHLADLSADMRLLQQAQQAARDMLRRDPDLARAEHRPVLQRVRQLFNQTPDIFN